jgi:hypothetical protein
VQPSAGPQRDKKRGTNLPAIRVTAITPDLPDDGIELFACQGALIERLPGDEPKLPLGGRVRAAETTLPNDRTRSCNFGVGVVRLTCNSLLASLGYFGGKFGALDAQNGLAGVLATLPGSPVEGAPTGGPTEGAAPCEGADIIRT